MSKKPQQPNNDTIIDSVLVHGQTASKKSYDDTQEEMVELLLQTKEEYADELPELRNIKLSKEHAKWRALSSLQKAVRRGNVTNALAMASALINSDQGDHVLKRMCTIALEDVAFGNPQACARMFAFAASVKIRNQTGGDRMFLHLISELTTSMKDRIPCEIAVSAGYSPEDDDHKKELYAMEHDDLVALAKDLQNNHWQDVQTATRLLSGSMKMAGDFMNDHRDMPSFRECFADCPPLIRYIAHRSAAGGGESAGLVSGMRLGWHLLYSNNEADPITVEVNDFDDPTVVKGVLLEALDMHTQEGKQAFKILLANEGESFAEWVTEKGGNPMEALGNGVFMTEGKLCDRRWNSNDIDQITQVSHDAQMGRSCLPVSQFGKLMSEVVQLLPALNKYRAKILTG